MKAWNKGLKMPHSEEWEKNRLKAIKENAYKLRGRKSPKSKETIKIALTSLNQKRKDNPEKYKQISINNLPKNCKGSKNGNWKNNVTKKSKFFRVRFWKKFDKWREEVLKRDDYTCQDCGSKERLEAHHIVSLFQLPSAAFIRANGITLCKNCHKKTDSYANNKQKKIQRNAWRNFGRKPVKTVTGFLFFWQKL